MVKTTTFSCLLFLLHTNSARKILLENITDEKTKILKFSDLPEKTYTR